MPFSIRYNLELKAIETIFHGVVNEADIKTQMRESRAIAATYGTSHAVINFTDADLRLSIAFIYSLPELCESLGAKRPVRLAVINLNQQNEETIGFYQLVSQNRGWNVEVFSRNEQAKAWLLA